MKRNTILISLIVALLLAHPLFSQPTYNLKISNIENEAVVGGNFDLTVQIQAASDSFSMGTSNLVLSFNPNALSQNFENTYRLIFPKLKMVKLFNSYDILNR